jgi:2-polyprenyl-6-methoxyphenol hydroxylase-like FAD-dependent oxidoreductase
VSIEVPVLVAGGGPVGLVTALELQARGVRVLLVERHVSTTHHPKMDITNGRSMELFRRLGVAERIRDIAVPRENCMDVSWVTRLNEWELARFRYPNVHEARDRIRSRNDGSQPLEPPMRLSQVVLEPELVRLLGASPRVELRFGWVLVSCIQEEESVRATIREERSGREVEVRCQLLAGCDGAGSLVREQLGFTWDGSLGVGRMFMVHFRSSCRELLQRFGVAWHYQSPVGGSLVAQDDRETWTLHIPLRKSVDASSIQPLEMVHQCLGREFPLEVLQSNLWRPHLVSATGYGRGRIWMAGDAVHQYIPTGGYGMNTGIGDAVDLAWKFAAVLAGWGGTRLLQSIDAERRPVGQCNRDAARDNTAVRNTIVAKYDELIHDASARGAAAREAYGQLITELGNAENEALGIEFGYRYRDSPVICGEPDEPAYELLEYVPSTWPGVRAPHVFLSDGSPIFDRFGFDFTLLRFGDADPGPLIAAARLRGVPLTLVNIDDAHVARIYERPLVLVRPDHHVAWRGDGAPADALAVIDRVRGA